MRKMRDSGVEWIGQMPEEWELERLQWHLEEVVIKNNPIQTTQVLSLTNKKGVIPYEEKGNQGNVAKESYDGYKIAYPDTIVANSMNILIGSVGYSNYYGCVSPVYYVFREKPNNDLKFINYIMQIPQFQKELRRYANGILEIRLRISAGDILRRLCAFPNYEEQKRISAYLDNKCGRIDEVIALQEKIISRLNEYKTSLVTEAVTRGIKQDSCMVESNIKWIKRIPKHWKTFRVANLYEQTSEDGLEELPILTVSINSGISDRELADDEKDRVFVRSEDRTKYKRVRPGDLAYNMMRAWQGAFGAVRVDGMVSPAYVTCRPKSGVEIDTRYIEYLFRTPIAIEEMHRYSHGIADFRLRLYWPEFKNIRLCLPPIEEQMEIADYIDEKTAKIEATIKMREDTIAKLQEYKKSLIYEVVTGKKEVL